MISGVLSICPALWATDPATCDQYDCKEVHSYWKGEKDYVWRVYDDTGLEVKDGRQNIFTPSSDASILDISGTSTWNHYTWTACTPLCGKDANGVWQAYQEVTPHATGLKGKQATKMIRGTCQSSGGKKVTNPINSNKDENTPPGPQKVPE